MVFRGFFNKIKQGLDKTRGVFSGVATLFRLKGRVDRDFLKELEKRLYLADVGSVATAEIVERVRQAFLDKEITGDIEVFVKEQLKALVATETNHPHVTMAGQTVVMATGDNRAGTTTPTATP